MAHISIDQACCDQTTQRRGVRSALRRMLTLHRQRSALARLDAAQLHDLGLTAEQAKTESERAAWDVPQHWKG